MAQVAPLAAATDDQRLIQEATRRAAVKLGLTHQDLGDIIGVRREVFSRKNAALTGKQLELCLLLLRATRALAAIMGQDTANMAHWIRTENRGLQGVPKALMKTVPGLVHTVQYLDAARAKV
jgi:signal transduction histidine kinase